MKTTELNKIIKEIKFVDKFIKNGRLAYYIIKDKSGAAILIGFYLDSSVDKDAFFLQYFVQCLYVPFSTYNFSLGERIGNHWKKEETKKNISQKHQKNAMKIDLHFDQLVKNPHEYDSWERLFIQKERLMEVLDFCKANKIKRLEIIHGLGEGVLQELVYDVLRGYTGIEFEENEFFKHQSASVEVRFL